jgi:ribosomal protein S13
MSLPTMSEQDRQAALAKAQQARTTRRDLLNRLKTGQASITDALDSEDPAIQKTKVTALLKALPGYGETTVARLMEHLGIPENRRVRGLGERQRATLLATLDSTPTADAQPEPEATVTELPTSIQGDQQHEASPQRATEGDVDRYVDRVSDDVLACRERGRHLFPSIREAGIVFTSVDDHGLFLRRLTCTCCGLAVKVEKWSGSTRRGRRTRFERVGANLEYRTGPDGQTYLAPSGQGHITPRQIGDSVASKALAGQSLAALRKAAARNGTATTGPSSDGHGARSNTG